MNEQESNLSSLAREVVELGRNQLIMNMRFLDLAVSRLSWKENDRLPLATDGRLVVYQPAKVLKMFREDRNAFTHAYLHVLMHCVLRHMYVRKTIRKELWDLACDVAVEHLVRQIMTLEKESAYNYSRRKVLSDLRQRIGDKNMTAEKIYDHWTENPLSYDEMQQFSETFRIDDHILWYTLELPEELKALIYDTSEEYNQIRFSSDGKSRKLLFSFVPDRNLSEEDWKMISERMQMDLEHFADKQKYGSGSGGLLQNLKEVNRERYDYTTFLKKFAVLGEAMQMNPDEFDYIFYTYGLELYQKMPLIEPLEYREMKRIKEFAIAIDTSGSVSGQLVQTFIQKTYNILQSTESFFQKINLHIIQCDARIREDVKITSREEFNDYLHHMQLKGFGGTDFRPVFEHVEELRKNKELTDLKGLIYFTDGYGHFPEKMPDYKTAFVFIEGDSIPEVPPWAIKLVLGKSEILS